MFGWFKRKKKPNIESAQKQAPVIAIQQAPAKPITQITQEKKAESDRLYQERQALQKSFDPYNINLAKLDTSKLKPSEIQFLKKIVNQPVENPYVAGYWEYEYGLKFPVIMTKLLGNDYLTISSAADNLEYLTLPELKDILRKNSLPVSGKKGDLIQRIIQNISKDVLSAHLGNHNAHYKKKKKGRSIASNAHNSITKDTEFEDACLSAIREMDFNKAFRLVCKFEIEKPFARGIGIDWKKKCQDGLSQQEQAFYTRILDGSSGIERAYRECVILSYMLGASRPKPLIKRICGAVDESLLDSANYSLKKSKALLDIESYKAMDVERYEILGTEDDRTCPKCQKMNGKVFSLSKAQIGENFPPFCQKCRCTTVVHYDD